MTKWGEAADVASIGHDLPDCYGGGSSDPLPLAATEDWKEQALQMHLNDPELTVREIATRSNVEFGSMTNYLKKQMKKRREEAAARPVRRVFEPSAPRAFCPSPEEWSERPAPEEWSERPDFVWQKQALQMRLDDPELTDREIGTRCFVEFKRMNKYLQKQMKERREAANAASAGNDVSACSGDTSSDSPQPFRYVVVDDDLMGMVAIRDIKQGELLLEEDPIFVIPSYIRSNKLMLERFVGRQATENPDKWSKVHKQVMALHDALNTGCAEKTFSGVVHTNAFADNEGNSVILPVLSRFNHSCLPNASYGSGRAKQFSVLADKAIKQGEEICVTYLAQDKQEFWLPRELRRAYLHHHKAFWCKCVGCDLPSEVAVRESDKRRGVIWATVEDLKRRQTDPKQNPHKGIDLVEKLLELHEKESYVHFRSELNYSYSAFQMCMQVRNDRGARRWIIRCLAVAKVCFGDGATETRMYAAYKQNPKLWFEGVWQG